MPKKQRQQLANPLAPGGVPHQQQFLGIGNPAGAQINFDNDALEAELSDLLGEDDNKELAKPAKKPEKKLMPWEELGSMVDDCMVDVDDMDDDLDDADFEDELNGIISEEEVEVVSPKALTPSPQTESKNTSGEAIRILTTRVEQYKKAVEVSEGSKKKRMERQFKSLETMLKKAKRGGAINVDDIPSPPAGIGLNPVKKEVDEEVVEPVAELPKTVPASPPKPIATTSTAPPPVPQRFTAPPASTAQSTDSNAEKIASLTRQRDDYKKMALTAKKNNDKETALANLGRMKQIQAALNDGNFDFILASKQTTPPPPPASKPVELPPTSPSAPKTPIEALIQRRAQFNDIAEQSKKDGNSSKARRYGRIIKQYDQAIRELKKGGKPDFGELPDLPNMAPIPGYAKKELTLDDAINAAKTEPDETPKTPPKSPPKVAPAPPPKQLSHQLSHDEMPQLDGAVKAGSDGSSKYAQQLDFLNSRYAQFKGAAIAAKAEGDKEKALGYLRSMKGMEKMIESARSGLPIDIRQLPQAPSSVPVVEMSDPRLQRQDSTGVATRLLSDLADQVKKARSLSTQFTKLGNVDKAAMMEKWASTAQRDYDMVRMATKRGDPMPRVNYEKRQIQIIKRFNDLSESECEVTIKRILELGDHSSLSCFVYVEFPYPREKMQQMKSGYIKDKSEVALNMSMKMQINRGHMTFKRAVKNKSIKVCLVQKGGMFSSEKILGTGAVPLVNLEQKCQYHGVIQLMEDKRKPIATKVEILLRVSDPFEGVEIVNEEVNWATVELKQGQRVQVDAGVAKTNNIAIRCMSLIALDIKQVDQHCALAKQKQDRNALVQWMERRKKLALELDLTRQYIAKSTENRNQYILVVKVQLADVNEKLKVNIQGGQRTKAADYLKRKKAIESELQKFSANRSQYM